MERKTVATRAYGTTLETLEAHLKARHDAPSWDLSSVNEALEEVRRDLQWLRSKR